MIEILEVKEPRYKDINQIPIQKHQQIRNRKSCLLIDKAYKEIRYEFVEQLSKEGLEEKIDCKQSVRVFNKNFLNIFIAVWKESVFEKTKYLAKNELGPEKEKEIIEKFLEDGEIQEKVRNIFLKNIPLIRITSIKNS